MRHFQRITTHIFAMVLIRIPKRISAVVLLASPCVMSVLWTSHRVLGEVGRENGKWIISWRLLHDNSVSNDEHLRKATRSFEACRVEVRQLWRNLAKLNLAPGNLLREHQHLEAPWLFQLRQLRWSGHWLNSHRALSCRWFLDSVLRDFVLEEIVRRGFHDAFEDVLLLFSQEGSLISH